MSLFLLFSLPELTLTCLFVCVVFAELCTVVCVCVLELYPVEAAAADQFSTSIRFVRSCWSRMFGAAGWSVRFFSCPFLLLLFLVIFFFIFFCLNWVVCDTLLGFHMRLNLLLQLFYKTIGAVFLWFCRFLFFCLIVNYKNFLPVKRGKFPL